MTEPGEFISREYLRDLLTRWRDGVVSAPDMFAEARALWLSRGWPAATEDSPDAVALNILSMLGEARDMGITHEDIPALLEYLNTPKGEESRGWDRFGAYVEGVDSRKREALLAAGYYGPTSPDTEDERWEIGLSDPEQRRIHRGVRHEPDSVWNDVRVLLCAPPPRDEMFLDDIVEDLFYSHADAFIDRIEQLAAECPGARWPLVRAHIGGIASSPALERFWSLQNRLERDFVARGEMEVWPATANEHLASFDGPRD